MGAHVYGKQIVCVGICGPLPPTLAALSPIASNKLAHIFFPQEFYQPHRRTMTVMTRPSVQSDRARCITPSPLNNPSATIPILLLKNSRSWEPEKLPSNYERMPIILARPWVPRHSQVLLGTSPFTSSRGPEPSLSLDEDSGLRGSNQLSVFH